MSESQPQPTKRDSARTIQFAIGILCFLCFINGLSDVVTASAAPAVSIADQTIRLVFGGGSMVFGGIGAALAGWLVMRNRT
jgi:hypothetical protein